RSGRRHGQIGPVGIGRRRRAKGKTTAACATRHLGQETCGEMENEKRESGRRRGEREQECTYPRPAVALIRRVASQRRVEAEIRCGHWFIGVECNFKPFTRQSAQPMPGKPELIGSHQEGQITEPPFLANSKAS
ncbi:unnamed protein product, partial [Protopolystoma xenopodis]